MKDSADMPGLPLRGNDATNGTYGMFPLSSKSTTQANGKAYLSSRTQPDIITQITEPMRVMSAGDEEHDVLRTLRILERSGVRSHLPPRLQELTMEQHQLSCTAPRIKRHIYVYNSSSKRHRQRL